VHTDAVPTLHTRRLRLAPQRAENLDRLHAWYNDAEIRRLSADDPVGPNLERVRALLEGFVVGRPDQRRFAIYPRESAEPLGFADVVMIDAQHRRCKLALVIGERARWGRGYGREVLAELVRYCFEDLDMNRLAAEIYDNNPRSLRLFESLGFVREGTLRESVLREAPIDEHCYALLRREWRRAD
jgi:RimJ/RimL family protein N-acetyltransferase